MKTEHDKVLFARLVEYFARQEQKSIPSLIQDIFSGGDATRSVLKDRGGVSIDLLDQTTCLLPTEVTQQLHARSGPNVRTGQAHSALEAHHPAQCSAITFNLPPPPQSHPSTACSMGRYSDWIWSPAHERFYMYQYGDDDVIMETLWSDPPEGFHEAESDVQEDATVGQYSAYTQSNPYLAPLSHNYVSPTTAIPNQDVSHIRADDAVHGWGLQSEQTLWDASTENPSLIVPGSSALEAFPQSLQPSLESHHRRIVTNDTDPNMTESLDPHYRRISSRHGAQFFVPGRVFAMLWAESAGELSPETPRGSSESLVMYAQPVYSEIRRFVVVRNKGSFSQCVPVHTYGNRGATKPGLQPRDHSVIYTSSSPPPLLPGEELEKEPIRVRPTGANILLPESRINYGKSYAVEHNVKVQDLGMVEQRDLSRFKSYYHETKT